MLSGGLTFSDIISSMLIQLLFTDPLVFILVAVALIISISIHEFAHAFVALKLGDSTAKSMGRVTLDPRAHLDPLGTVMLLIAGFGWGRPVPFNPYSLKNPKRDAALISFAGPASNLLLAVLSAAIVHLLPVGEVVWLLLFFVVRFNLILAIFNLIPIHPLDGFKVVNGFLSEELSYQWLQIAPYGIWILLVLIMTGFTGRVIGPLLSFLLALLGFQN